VKNLLPEKRCQFCEVNAIVRLVISCGAVRIYFRFALGLFHFPVHYHLFSFFGFFGRGLLQISARFITDLCAVYFIFRPRFSFIFQLLRAPLCTSYGSLLRQLWFIPGSFLVHSRSIRGLVAGPPVGRLQVTFRSTCGQLTGYLRAGLVSIAIGFRLFEGRSKVHLRAGLVSIAIGFRLFEGRSKVHLRAVVMYFATFIASSPDSLNSAHSEASTQFQGSYTCHRPTFRRSTFTGTYTCHRPRCGL